jgi:uncharacterized membrane protein
MDYIVSFLVFGVTFALIDVVWLKSMKALYVKELGGLLRHKPDLLPAVAFYLLYILGATFLVVMPAVSSGAWWHAATMGLLFGTVTYATYDLTNLSTLKGWSKRVSGIDIAWGAVLTAIASVVTYIVLVWL